MKRIWIPEIKELGWQTSIEFIINTQIVQIFPDKELNLLMESALEHEEYVKPRNNKALKKGRMGVGSSYRLSPQIQAPRKNRLCYGHTSQS